MRIRRDEKLKVNHKILLAEDDAPSRDALERILNIWGFIVDSAADGEEALRKFVEMEGNSQNYALLITDDRMPRLSGRELLREIKARNPSLPTIIMTGFGEEEFEIQMAKLGCDAILYKPIEAEVLRGVVRKLIANSNSGERAPQ